MISLRRLKYLLPITLLVSSNTSAQKIDDKTYQQKMDLMEKLSIYKMTVYDTLFHIATLDSFHGNEYRHNYYGWINKWEKENLKFINTDGNENVIDRAKIKEIEVLPINNSTIQIFIDNLKQDFGMGDFGKNYLLNLWLYKKGQKDYSKQLLPKNDTFFSDKYIIQGFGIIYYDEMLKAYSYDRNYKDAIVFGKQLSKDI